MLPYVVSQLAAGFLAALVAANLIVTGSISEDYPIEMFEPSGMGASIIVSELLFTFALVFVILNVATSESNEGNGFYGCCNCIGSTGRGSNSWEHISRIIQSGSLPISGSYWENGFCRLMAAFGPSVAWRGGGLLSFQME